MKIPGFNDVAKAHELISPYVHRTPVLTGRSIDQITGGTLFFKCENFQKVGAFKFRGAANAVFSAIRRGCTQRRGHPFVGESCGCAGARRPYARGAGLYRYAPQRP
jgi:threonine dehydratase